MIESENSKTKIRAISQGYNSWKVQILFQDQGLTFTDVPEKLREVKIELAQHFGVPNALLEYTNLLGKSRTENGLMIEIQIIKHEYSSGAPRFRTLSQKAADGTPFSDMQLEADLYPLDEFDKPLTKEAIRERVAHEGYDLSCLNWETISEALTAMEQTSHPLLNYVIGQGRLPDVGKDSALIYNVNSDQESFSSTAWIGIRPVYKNDFLLEVTPADAGLHPGKNIYGRELEPRRGIDIKLEAAEGTKLNFENTKLIASRSGLLIIERHTADKRQRDQRNLTPVKLTCKVLPSVKFTDTKVYALDLKDLSQIYGNLLCGSRLCSEKSLYIHGNIEANSHVNSQESIRIVGNAENSEIFCSGHLVIIGNVVNCTLRSAHTIQIEGKLINSKLFANEVIADEIQGGHVEAIAQTQITYLNKSNGHNTTVHINVEQFLQDQQSASKEVIEELRNSLTRMIDIFGPKITMEVKQSTVHRYLLLWLGEQKSAISKSYSHTEVQQYKKMLEMIPLIREKMTSVGMELREVTELLSHHSPKA